MAKYDNLNIRMSVSLTGIFITFFLARCESMETRNPLVYKNDMESAAGWFDCAPLIQRGSAVSGLNANKLDKDYKYSVTFKSTLGNISHKSVQAVNVGLWANLGSPDADAVLVVAIDSAGHSLFWQGISLYEQVFKAREWTEVKQRVQLPATHSSNTLMIYVWNKSDKEILLDDFVLFFEEKP